MNEAPPPSTSVHWHQFRSHTLFLFVFLAAIFSAWIAPKVQLARRRQFEQQRLDRVTIVVEEAVRKIGGARDSFFVRPNYVGGPFDVSIDLDKKPVTDELLEHLVGLTERDDVRLLHLGLSHTRVTDVGLSHLSGMSALEGLSLDGTQVCGSGLPALPNLKRLTLFQASVNDEGLASVAELRQLQVLELRGNYQFSDSGLKHLAKLKRLEKLLISSARIRVAKNRVITVGKYTDDGIQELRRALPGCKIGSK